MSVAPLHLRAALKALAAASHRGGFQTPLKLPDVKHARVFLGTQQGLALPGFEQILESFFKC